MRIPNHIGIIPDGNRRWAESKSLEKHKGYKYGLLPGIKLFNLCKKKGIKEITYYGFTMDNTKRPKKQRKAFTNSCIKAVNMLSEKDANLLVIGNKDTPSFPDELKPYCKRKKINDGGIKVNFLVNYGWKWDLANLIKNDKKSNKNLEKNIKSKDISRIDLIIRWGGRRRLSGFLPVQSVYSDIYIVNKLWPDFKEKHFENALNWYDKQDITLGG